MSCDAIIAVTSSTADWLFMVSGHTKGSLKKGVDLAFAQCRGGEPRLEVKVKSGGTGTKGACLGRSAVVGAYQHYAEEVVLNALITALLGVLAVLR